MIILSAIVFCLAVSAAVTDIPFDPERGLVEVEVVLDGRVQGTFGIDTGADGFYIDRDFALSNHLRLKEEPSQYSVVSIEGGSDVHAVSIRSLQIGHDRLFNLSAAAIDMSALNLDPAIEHPDGLLGHDILRRFYVTIDYPDQTMRLETMQPSFLRTDSYYSIPFKIYGHFIVVEVTFDEQTTVPMAVDYCASHTVITPELAERLDLSSDLGKIHTIPEMKLTREVVSTDVISAVSDLTSVLKLVPRSRIQGILGATFLHSHRLTVDYRRQMIYIHQD